MSIKLNNFVNINIDYINSIASSGARDVVAFLDDTTVSTRTIGVALTGGEATWKNLSEFIAAFGEGHEEDALADPMYPTVACYFNNGGKKLHYVQFTSGSGVSLATTIASLPSEEIVVCSNKSASEMYSAAIAKSAGTGIDEKLFLSSITVANIATDPFNGKDNCCLKVGNPGCEMAIAAYLSRVNIDNSTIQDYCFTAEVLNGVGTEVIVIVDDDATFKTIKSKKNLNCDVYMIGTDIRNYGGNTCGQIDLVNYFVKIVLTQTLTNALVRVLRNKIKYDSIGLGIVSATIVDELNRYRNAGYFSFDKTWTGGDVYDESGNYLIISNDTPLVFGYYLTILPFSSLTAADKQAHKLPEIYLYLADAYGVREIEITGHVI